MRAKTAGPRALLLNRLKEHRSLRSASRRTLVPNLEYGVHLNIAQSRAETWIAASYADEAHLAPLRQTFAETDAVRLPALLPESAHARLTAAVKELRGKMRNRAFVMPGYGTPRVMSVLGASVLVAAIPMLLDLYDAISDLVSTVECGRVYRCKHTEEFIVLNRLDGRCATHGWHRDDPAYAVTLMLQTPGPSAGGVVEYIPRWSEACAAQGIAPETPVESAVEVLRAEGFVQTMSLRAGDAYLLRANTCLHRVTPLLDADASRVVLNLAFQDSPTITYDGTADLLYG